LAQKEEKELKEQCVCDERY